MGLVDCQHIMVDDESDGFLSRPLEAMHRGSPGATEKAPELV